MPRKEDSDQEIVYEAAESFVDGPLAEGTALFDDSKQLWEEESAVELHEKFVEDGIEGSEPFHVKLNRQLDGTSDRAKWLMAELLYVHFLVAHSSSIGGDKKREHVDRVLSWMTDPVAMPEQLERALDTGLASTGMGFLTLRYWMVGLLVEFALAWTQLEPTDRTRFLNKPWSFREFVFAIEMEKSTTQRHALLHLVFPDVFEPIVSENDKEKITDHFTDLSSDETDNIDRQLRQIRPGLEERRGQSFASFYDDEIRREWDPDSVQISERNVWAFRGNPDKHTDLRGALRDARSEPNSWSVTQLKEEIESNDLVLFWRTGDDAGLIGAGELTGEPQPRDEDEKFLGADDEHGVIYDCHTVLDEPVSRSTFRDDPVLEAFAAMTAGGGTNFRVDDREWRRLLAIRPELAGSLPIDQEPEDVALASSFRPFFNDRSEAEWFYSLLAGIADHLDVDAPGDANVSVHLRRGATPEIGFDVGAQKVAAARGPGFDGPRVQLVLDSELAAEADIEATETDGETPIDSGELHDMTVDVARQLTEPATDDDRELPRVLARALDDVESTASTVRNTSDPAGEPSGEALEAVFDSEFRRRVLREGLTAFPPIIRIPELAEDLFVSESRFRNILGLLRTRKNVILQGPPGVGKTFMAERLAYGLMGQRTDERVEMVQFHQSYTYEDFIQGYRPDGDGGFRRENGVFWEFCERAGNAPGEDFVFIIDEINRGNLSKIFGELMMLIERDKRGPEHAVPLQYADDGEETFAIPENVYLLGMMNTADRSLAMVDYALRRRFAFVDLEPAFGTDAFDAFLGGYGVPDDLRQRIRDRLGQLNETIAADNSLGEGFRIGHSYFTPRERDRNYDEEWYREVIHHDVEPLLREYWFDDPDRVEAEVDRLLDRAN